MNIPEFAVLGHPNEGKSTVVSTLSEDDGVKISRVPGETVVCRSFPVLIDGKEILTFTDTPGFQVPKKTLKWFNEFTGKQDDMVHRFISEHRDQIIFRDECELLTPVERGAGIIYVVDGSRPVRQEDRAEMEILRLTGKPRMAIINSKNEDHDFSDDWKNEFRKSFNSVRVFNAAKATFPQRISLLNSLKSIDQDWENTLDQVITAYQKEWKNRNQKTSLVISTFLYDSMTLTVTENFKERFNEKTVRDNLLNKYKKTIKQLEKKALEEIRNIYKHHRFKPELPEHSILHDDLFNEKNWQALGLTPGQLVTTGAACGSAAGVLMDIAVAGHSLGLFAAAGGIIGAGSALIGGKKMAQTKIYGQKLGGYKIKIGPNENIQFMYVLLDRLLIYYTYLIRRSHGNRDTAITVTTIEKHGNRSYTSEFSHDQRKKSHEYYLSLKKSSSDKTEKIRHDFEELIYKVLSKMSE